MTEIAKASHDPVQRAKWRAQAGEIAKNLKAITDWGGHEVITAGVVFDDQFLRVRLEVALIQRLSEHALAEVLFNAVINNDSQPAEAGPLH